uniref:Adhesion G protein-coupled receptor E8 n=1 Tax=Neolamprologus brichardi TaxID=32507 RepID=A0A3Q4GJV2_NEOBR
FLFNEWFSISFVMRNLPGSATAAFMTLNGMESLLSHQYFQTEKKTDMCSDVITAILPTFNVSSLLFQEVPETGTVSCVYWKTTETVGGKSMSWSEEGCWVAFSNENYTICSCSHLSTFALIMQIGEWLNRICVIIGLFFLALAIFTFLLCSWNPKINNTARLHLCLNLFFSQLLLLWNDKYTDNKLACTVLAGFLHFLIVASFVWMLLEALQLHLLVRKLSQVQVIRRDGLPRPILYLVGYGVPFVIVGVSALIYSDGYGVTSTNVCVTHNYFHIFPCDQYFSRTAVSTLSICKCVLSSDVSQSKDTRLIIFKIVAQFVILGCTWILGLYQSNLFFQVLFIILNSQQGTFLYIVHCLLNKEVDLSLSYALITFCSFTTSHLNAHTRPIVAQ